MILAEGMRPAVTGLRLAAADVTARGAEPKVDVAAALLADTARRLGNLGWHIRAAFHPD